MKTIKTRKEFDALLKESRPLTALFYSAWCPFCISFMPVFEKKAAAGTASAAIKVCTDDLPELEDLFAIDVVPSVLFFKDGKLAARLDGQLGRGITGEALDVFIKDAASAASRAKK